MVKGVLALDVSFPSTTEISQTQPGRLEYKTSPDGMAWSAAQVLSEGHHEIPITSASGVCYVLFSGTRVVIDNIAVSLYSTPVTIQVPRDFATLQAAIDAAGDGDLIELAKGTYSGPGLSGHPVSRKSDRRPARRGPPGHDPRLRRSHSKGGGRTQGVLLPSIRRNWLRSFRSHDTRRAGLRLRGPARSPARSQLHLPHRRRNLL